MVSSKYLVRDWSVSKDGQNVSFFSKKKILTVLLAYILTDWHYWWADITKLFKSHAAHFCLK